MPDDLADVIDTLRARRAEHLASVELLDAAIDNLTKLVAGNPPVPLTPDPAQPLRSAGSGASVIEWPPPKSVKQLVIDLLDESGRAWNADEIIAEYKRRGLALKVQDPRNSMFSALSRLSKAGEIERVGHGRYIGKRFAASTPDLTSPAVHADDAPMKSEVPFEQ